MRQPMNRQSLSSAISAIETWSRPCTSDWKASWRSGIHFTVRFSRREAHTTIGYSGCTKIFMPKPPPTSPVRTRSFGEPILRIMSATTGRIMCTPCEESHSVERSSLASYSQIAPRGSIELTTSRWLTSCSFTTLSALAKAASVLAWSPIAQSNTMLSLMWSCTSGAPGWAASKVPTTCGRAA